MQLYRNNNNISIIITGIKINLVHLLHIFFYYYNNTLNNFFLKIYILIINRQFDTL